MKKDLIIFCRVAWMKYYRGVSEDDRPAGGGSYVKDNGDGGESRNFLPYNHYCCGYVQHKGATLRLERIAGDKYLADEMEGVTVVWVAKHPNDRSYIVGWYENATAYRNRGVIYDDSRIVNDEWYPVYFFKAKEEDCILLPVKKRTFEIPLAAKIGEGQGMGQSNVWYADTYKATMVREKAFDYIRNYSGEKESIYLTAEDLKRPADDTGESVETLLKLAKEIPDPAQALPYANLLLTKEHSFEALRVRAIILYEMCCYDEAEEAYRKALYESPDHIGCMIDLMCVEAFLDKDYAAVELGHKLLELMEDSEDKHFILRKTFALYLTNGDKESAVSLRAKYDSLAKKYGEKELDDLLSEDQS